MNCGTNFIRTQCNFKNDYECQRKCNIQKLKHLYNKELNDYYNTYNQYLQYKYAIGHNRNWKRAHAHRTIRPKVIRINARLNQILSDLKKNISHTKGLISAQEGQIETKNNTIYKLYCNLQLRDILSEFKILCIINSYVRFTFLIYILWRLMVKISGDFNKKKVLDILDKIFELEMAGVIRSLIMH